MTNHEFTRVYGEVKYCGDAYCTGHRDAILRCSCGYEQPAPPDHLTNTVDRLALIEHRLDSLEEKKNV